MTVFVNADIYTGSEILNDHAVIVKNGFVDAVLPRKKAKLKGEVIDLKGATLAPGFIDTQINGGGGVLLNTNPSQDGLEKVVKAHRRFGVTSMLPTVFTETEDAMNAMWSTFQSSKLKDDLSVFGVHFEGPLINPKKAGVHDPKKARGQSGAIQRALSERGDFCVLVTLAPELISQPDIDVLISNGAVVLAGHTAATYDQMNAAYDAGVKGATHLYNAMTGPSSREPGVVTSTLLSKTAVASIIVDGHHVHFASVAVAAKMMGSGRLYLVTDAMPPVGSDSSSFEIGPHKLKMVNGKCVTPDDTLGGSAADMATCVRNCIQKVGIPKDEALKMASTYVADIMGVSDRIGSISEGKQADFVVLTNEIQVLATVKKGEIDWVHTN